MEPSDQAQPRKQFYAFIVITLKYIKHKDPRLHRKMKKVGIDSSSLDAHDIIPKI